jgi:hypothetical protein
LEWVSLFSLIMMSFAMIHLPLEQGSLWCRQNPIGEALSVGGRGKIPSPWQPWRAHRFRVALIQAVSG